MSKTLSLRDANQSFARCIREVEAGEEIVITRNGKPVARLSPISKRRVLTAEQQAAWQRTQQRMAQGWDVDGWDVDGWDVGAGPLDRDALHER
jgi:prevent-host-death family protein